MIEITKNENGLSWNGRDWTFTQEMLENGYETIDDIHISIEVDTNIICLKSDDTTVDGVGPFQDSQELINAIYGVS